ncbi:hypothetical protein BOX15_Mlig031824g1, partial [Macrostomum lignano]
HADAVLNLWMVPILVATVLFLLAVIVALLLICREIYSRRRHFNRSGHQTDSASAAAFSPVSATPGPSSSGDAAVVRGTALIRMRSVHSSAEQLLPSRGDGGPDGDSSAIPENEEEEDEEDEAELCHP